MPSPGKQINPMQYWISFWPQAPFFGVEWRFAKVFPGVTWFNPSDTLGKMAAAGVAEAVKATEEAGVAAVKAQEEAAATIAEMTAQAMESAVAAVEATAEVIETAAAEVAAVETPAVETAAVEPEASVGVVPVPPAVLFDIAPADADDLRQIKGVGPKLAEMLNAMGIYRFEQIAGFSEANLAWVDQNLTAFRGRPLRDDWVAQAKALI
jgi:predicted flap endonuclease-1-like 5' DNA nuclease